LSFSASPGASSGRLQNKNAPPKGEASIEIWLWKKDSNLHGAVGGSAMCGGQPQSSPILVGPGITLCLSLTPHPRDKRACLPSFITPQSLRTSDAERTFDVVVEAKLKKCPKYSHFLKENFCNLKNIQIFAHYCGENSKTKPRWLLN
jgi:hypothetical protein